MSLGQRTPWGGGKKRGVENLTNDTPPKKGFWTPPRTVRFPPPSRVSALFFLYKNPRQSRPKALLEGSKNFRESAFSGTFSSPHTFCTPPYHGPTRGGRDRQRNRQVSAQALSKLPFSKLPLSFSPIKAAFLSKQSLRQGHMMTSPPCPILAKNVQLWCHFAVFAVSAQELSGSSFAEQQGQQDLGCQSLAINKPTKTRMSTQASPCFPSRCPRH